MTCPMDLFTLSTLLTMASYSESSASTRTSITSERESGMRPTSSGQPFRTDGRSVRQGLGPAYSGRDIKKDNYGSVRESSPSRNGSLNLGTCTNLRPRESERQANAPMF